MLISANLIEETDDGTPIILIGEATFSAVIRQPDGTREALDLLYDDGTHGDVKGNDGDFTGLYVNTDQPGVYEITLRGRKGAIPATGRLRVTVVPFPGLVVETPEAGRHEVRGEPLAFSVTLSGAEPPTLDQGRVAAEITTMDARVIDLPLEADEAKVHYTGSYLPTSDGDYQVRFFLVDAAYKGVSYEAEVSQTFSVVLVPTVTILDESIDLGMIEKAQMAKGVVVNLGASSTSQVAEPISVTLAGAPGVSLVDVQPSELGPVQETRLVLTLQGDDVEPGLYEATLTIAARDGVDMGRRQIPVSFNLYAPTLTIENAEEPFDLGDIRTDELAQTRQIGLDVHSTSIQGEPLIVADITGVDGVEVMLSEETIPSAKTTPVSVTLDLPHDLDPGTYQLEISLSTREWVEVTPDVLTVTWAVVPVPWLEIYGIPAALGALLLLCAILVAIIAIKRALVQRPWGVLIGVSVPEGELLKDYQLLQSDRQGRIFIGRGRRCQVRLDHPSIAKKHAVLFAKKRKMEDPDDLSRRPKKVKKPVCFVRNLSSEFLEVGGIRLREGQVSQPMRDNVHIRIGKYEFQWRKL
jgi:hypothetical protein